MEIQILCITKIALWGGGDRPQRGFMWGRPMGETAPTRFYQEAIERLLSYI
jgi:hypothetical protein